MSISTPNAISTPNTSPTITTEYLTVSIVTVRKRWIQSIYVEFGIFKGTVFEF